MGSTILGLQNQEKYVHFRVEIAIVKIWHEDADIKSTDSYTEAIDEMGLEYSEDVTMNVGGYSETGDDDVCMYPYDDEVLLRTSSFSSIYCQGNCFPR